MKKRIVLLTTLAAMMAAAMALSGVAQAKPIAEDKADKKCLVEAVRTVEQPGFHPSDYTFFGGTEGPDRTGTFTPTDELSRDAATAQKLNERLV